MKRQFGNGVIEVMEGDITALDRDAIVNAANAQLQLGGGVAGAIRQAGGPAIQEECDRIGGTYVGGAVITTGGSLKARHVIHAVGPRMGEGDEDNKLKNATLNALKVAEEQGLSSIAFPAVSAGIFGFPIDRCARIMLATARDFLEGGGKLSLVTFCLYGRESLETFLSAAEEL